MHGQWDAQISQYWKTRTYFNPSFAGDNSELQGIILHRQQWIGITRAPKTFIISADMPINFFDRTHGVGVMVMTESIGLYKNQTFGGQYVYKKKFGKNVLNVGIQLGMVNIGFDASKIYIPDGTSGEEGGSGTGGLTGIGEDAKVFDGNFGVSWVAPRYYAGLSVSHVLEPTYELSENYKSYIARTYYLTGGCNIPFSNPLYELQPSFLVKSDAVFTQIDVTARLMYNKMFTVGASWRKDDGFVFLLGVKIKKFDAGYAYDLSTSEISRASSGTHEFFVRYSMPFNLPKDQKNKRKSVRIL